MSYDVSLMVSAGSKAEVEAFWRNHTSNTAVMWREAGCDLAEFHDRPASDLIGPLTSAVHDIERRPDYYAQWNPPNGWGSVETTLQFLMDILGACVRFPDARVEVSR